jgi:pimeloyl-ACP methyl ester carboxylesterase
MPTRDVLFLPGFMCDARLFGPQRACLESEGFQTMVGDLRGQDSVEALAASVLGSAPDRFALVGLSLGGIVALEVLRQAAERVTHLALLNATARADAASERRRAQLERVARGELRAIVTEELAPLYFGPSNRSPERLALVLDMAQALGAGVFARQTRALLNRHSYVGMLGEVECPALVVGGAEDVVCPLEIQREIAGAIPAARLVAIAGCGHLSTIERPGDVSGALLELLQEARPGRPRGLCRGSPGLDAPEASVRPRGVEAT